MNTRSDASSGLNALSTGTKIIVPAAVLLLIDLFLSWQKACVDTPIGDVCGTASGWDGFWGVLTGLLTIVLLVWIGLQIANVDLSGVNMPVSNAMITLGLGVLVLAATLIKLLTIIGDESSWPAYVGIILAAVAAYGAYVRSREVEDMPATGSGSLGGPDTRPADAPAERLPTTTSAGRRTLATASDGTTLARRRDHVDVRHDRDDRGRRARRRRAARRRPRRCRRAARRRRRRSTRPTTRAGRPAAVHDERRPLRGALRPRPEREADESGGREAAALHAARQMRSL